MTKAIFTTRISPSYDDLPENFYHFPRQYLRRVQATVGDWIIYYQPSRTGGAKSVRQGSMAYFATAKVVGIREDLSRPGHYYADVTGYLEFDHAVPFRNGNRFYESALRNSRGETATGAFQNAVRHISDEEFHAIAQDGYAALLNTPPQVTPGVTPLSLKEGEVNFERPIVEVLTRRPFRDAAFSATVRSAYDSACAMTDLRLINGGGRCEIEAAHIRPVGDGHNGPDSVRNGLALSRTMHWLFDRGLISISDSFEILTAGNMVPLAVQKMLRADRRIRAPDDPAARPHPLFLKYHRDHVFKG